MRKRTNPAEAPSPTSSPAPHPLVVKRRARRVAATIVAMFLALAGPLGLTAAKFWQSTGDGQTFVDRERVGVRYLSSLTTLLATLTDAEVPAVELGGPPPAAVVNALTAVGADDQAVGAVLGTTQRWTDLRRQVTALTKGNLSGQAAYTAYSQVVAQTVLLVGQAADASDLILDPDSDSYHLVDALVLRVPQLEADSATAVALTFLGTQQHGPSSSSSAAQVFVALDRISANATAVDNGLQRAFTSTASATLGPNLLGPVDHFRAALSAFAPPTDLISLPVALPASANIGAARDQAQSATVRMTGVGLTELGLLLERRHAALAGDRLQAEMGAAIGAGLLVLLGWTLVPNRRIRPEIDDLGDESLPPPDPGSRVEEEIMTLIDARDLLDSGELRRVGRAVAPARRTRINGSDGGQDDL